MTAEHDAYYSRPECSNSDLSFLNKYTDGFEIMYDIEQVQNFGTLLDCMITEPSRVNYFKYTCCGIEFTPHEFRLAEEMKKAFFRDELCRMLVDNSEMQKVTVDNAFQVEHCGFRFKMAFRMKADFNAKVKLGIIGDLKSTAATTQKGFIASILLFQYHRQAAVYMDLEKCDKFIIIGVTKSAPFQIFKVTITRDSDLYKQGRELYQELAFKHFYLFDGLRIAA